MRSEIETDRGTDSSQSIGIGSESKSQLKWKRMKINPEFTEQLKSAGVLVTASVGKEIKRIAKQVNNVKRVMNG